jgi:hypothetical protein
MSTDDESVLPALFHVLEDISWSMSQAHLSFFIFQLHQIPLKDFTPKTIKLVSLVVRCDQKVWKFAHADISDLSMVQFHELMVFFRPRTLISREHPSRSHEHINV